MQVPGITRCAVPHSNTSQPTAELCSPPCPKAGLCEQLEGALGTVPARTRGCDRPSLQGPNERHTRKALCWKHGEKVKSSEPNRKTVKHSVYAARLPLVCRALLDSAGLGSKGAMEGRERPPAPAP